MGSLMSRGFHLEKKEGNESLELDRGDGYRTL